MFNFSLAWQLLAEALLRRINSPAQAPPAKKARRLT
jgi:hypothetical protein